MLYLAFNRPDKTKESFGAIRAARPAKLYVAVDAPREGNDTDVLLNKQVIEIVKNIDWDCDAHYLLQEKNLGCSRSGVAAWNWVFSTEDRMIFIEDDGVPSISFFHYCQELLERYKDDDRVAYIGGVNYGVKYGDASYFFSRECAATYAMATWKRVQDLYEYDMDSYEETAKKPDFIKKFINRAAYLSYKMFFENYRRSVTTPWMQRLNTYDCQMLYLVHKYDMYSIYPNVNMVSNIGLDAGANNHVAEDSDFYKKYSRRPRFEWEELVHPLSFDVNRDNELQMFRQRSLRDAPMYVVYVRYVKYRFRQAFPQLYKLYKLLRGK